MNSFVRRFLFIAMAVSFFDSHSAYARTREDGIAKVLPRIFEYDENGNRVGLLKGGMAYRYFLPKDYDPAVEYPLVLSMHGSGESGFDNYDQLVYLDNWIDKTESEYPAILVAPQLPQSVGWSPLQSQDRTPEILELLMSEFSVDENRLYATGLSMGGYGTMTYLQYYNVTNPGTLRFAAGAPAAGAWIDSSAVASLQETPIWLAHGSADGVVSPNRSRDTFNALAGEAIGSPINFDKTGANGPMAEVGNVRYTEYPGVGHGSWGPFYNSSDLYEWMFSQSLAVPEPSSLATAFVGVIFTMSRRRRNLRV